MDREELIREYLHYKNKLFIEGLRFIAREKINEILEKLGGDTNGL